MTPNTRAALLVGGGVLAFAAGLYVFTRRPSLLTAQASGGPLLPGPGPTPIPPSVNPQGELKGYHYFYKGVTATIAELPDTGGDTWVAFYFEPYGQMVSIKKRTNEIGIILSFRKAIDKYYSEHPWFSIDTTSDFTMSPGVLYRISIPLESANEIAIPGERLAYNELPADWPESDLDDPSRVRIQASPKTSTVVPSIGTLGLTSGGMRAWYQKQVPGLNA